MSWRDELPEELRDSPTLKDVEDVGSLAKQFVDQASYLGNSLRLPGEDATDEARAEFRGKLIDKKLGLMEVPNLEDADAMAGIYTTLGRPEKSDGYTKPEVEGAAVDDARFTVMATLAHEAGISDKQFSKVITGILQGDAELANTANMAREGELKGLREEWGTAYEMKVTRAAKLAELTGAPEGLIDAIKNNKADVTTLKWIDKLTESLGGEAAEMVSQGAGDDGKVTVMEAKARSQEILETLSAMSSADPRYDDLTKKRMHYMSIAYPG